MGSTVTPDQCDQSTTVATTVSTSSGLVLLNRYYVNWGSSQCWTQQQGLVTG